MVSLFFGAQSIDRQNQLSETQQQIDFLQKQKKSLQDKLDQSEEKADELCQQIHELEQQISELENEFDYEIWVMRSQTYGGPEVDSASSLVATSDGGYAIAGSTGSFDDGNWDFLLVKTDTLGTEEWNKTYGGLGADFVSSLIVTSDGGFALAGSSSNNGTFTEENDDFLLVKTDEYGEMEWSRTYGGINFEGASSLIETSDGGYVIAGSTLSLIELEDFPFFESTSDCWLVKTDEFGNMEWNKTYGGPDNDNVCSLIATSDGGYVMGGTANGDFWLIKIDALGVVEWNQTYGRTEGDYASSLVVSSDGGYAIAGYTTSFDNGNKDFWLVITDLQGIPEFSSRIILPLVFAVTLFALTIRKSMTASGQKQKHQKKCTK